MIVAAVNVTAATTHEPPVLRAASAVRASVATSASAISEENKAAYPAALSLKRAGGTNAGRLPGGYSIKKSL